MNLRDKKTFAIAVIILIIAVLLAFRFFREEGVSIVYKTAEVDRGDISSYVTATGTLNPVAKVEIGSRVSGVVKEVYVDFNSSVKKGGPLAEIDPAPFRAKLEQAEASLKKAQADVELTRNIMKANEELYGKRLIPKQEYDDSRVKYSSAVASLEQARSELEIAKSNLSQTAIRSPIDGIVMSKNINVGQTVTAGQDSPPLFVVAEDLARMNVNAYVSEADIGKVDKDQGAVFTVDAYPNETFEGKVQQVRNEPITNNNIVTYDVVILVDNKGLKLKPGMTAEVRILVVHKENALRIPRAALRFIPPPSVPIKETPEELDGGIRGSDQEGGQSGNRSSVVWTPLQDGQLKAVSIDTGISSDTYTEVLDGNLKEGEKVVVEAVRKGESGSEPLGPIVLPKPQRF